MTHQSTQNHEFDYATHWISRHVGSGFLGFDTGPLLTGVFKFGTIWNLTSLVYLATSWGEITTQFLLASALGQVWINLSPYLIWYYDERVMPEFFTKFTDIYEDSDELASIAKRYNEFYANYDIRIAILWVGLLWLGGWAGRPVLLAQGMDAFGGIFVYLSFAWAAYIGIVLAEPGFKGPVTTILLIREMADLEFEIQPLHPDQLGGLSTVGYFSIRTTLLFSTASLFLPLAFEFAAGSGGELLVTIVVATYILTVLASFVYPTYKINRTAAELRESILADLQGRLNQIKTDSVSDNEGEISELNRRLKIQELRQTYEDYNNVRLYPIQIDILLKLAGSVLLPLAFLFIETFLTNRVL